MIKPELKYGIVSGFLIICWTLIQYFLGFHTSHLHIGQYSENGMFLIILGALIMGLREKRDDLGRLFTTRNAMRSALILAFTGAFISSLFQFVYEYKINPIWVESLSEWQQQHDSAGGLMYYVLNDPQASSTLLSNTELHLCAFFLMQMIAAGVFGFFISAVLETKNTLPYTSSELEAEITHDVKR
jgi:membrane protease YdiL (CAAX protease family)